MKKIEERIQEALPEYQVNSFTNNHIMYDGRRVYQGYIVDKHKPNLDQLYIEFLEFPEAKRINDYKRNTRI